MSIEILGKLAKVFRATPGSFFDVCPGASALAIERLPGRPRRLLPARIRNKIGQLLCVLRERFWTVRVVL